jgi:phenylacetate-CoA ligase
MNTYSSIFEKAIFPLAELCKGTHILKTLEFLEDSQWWSEDRIRAFQQKRLRELIAHAYSNVPYYRSVFDQLRIKPGQISSLEDLQRLPVLTKDIIRRHFPDGMVALNVPKKRLLLYHSGGSTGEPLAYYLDRQAQSWRFACLFRLWKWAGYELGRRWVRLDLIARNKLSQRAMDDLSRCLFFRLSKMNQETLQLSVQEMRKFRPQIITGYASQVFLLAKYLRDNAIDDIRPKSIITTGDMLFSHYRQLIETQFHCRVYDTYGGNSLVVSGQCDCGTHHIAAENVIIEFVKGDRPVKPGEVGTVLVTDLRNYGMPFIRFMVGDLASPCQEPCKCGRALPSMSSLVGRDTDIVVTPGGNYLVAYFFGHIFESMMGVSKFQVVQQAEDEIEVKIVKNDKFSRQDASHIEDAIREGAGEEVKIRLNFVEDIPALGSGKLRLVISEIGRRHFVCAPEPCLL